MPGPRQRSQATRGAYYARTSGGGYEAPAEEPTRPRYSPGQPVVPDPENYWSVVDAYGNTVPAGQDDPGAFFDTYAYNADLKDYRNLIEGDSDGRGATGPSAAELAIERSKVHSQNLATYVDSVISGLQADIDAKRLSTEQAVGEFNRRMDALETGGTQFLGAQQYTIPRGVDYVPGFEPSGLATQLGLQPFKASPVEFDPFGMATQIVNETPNITGVGVPDTSAIQRAIDLAKSFT